MTRPRVRSVAGRAFLPVGAGIAVVVTAFLGLSAPSPAADEAAPLQRVVWADLEKEGVDLAGEVLPARAARDAALRVKNTTGRPRTIRLAVLEAPAIRAKRYEVTGRVRYEKVAKQGYLEMWSVFGDGSEYFTRTLAERGPMARIAGNSDWREFSLPFDGTGAQGPPVRLVVQLVLAGNGSVDIGPLELRESP
jgi:hypothetical protein